jgi:hypothetical protein
MNAYEITLQPGLVDTAVDWKWSSASWYLLQPLDNNYQGCRLFIGCRWACSIVVEGTLHWRSQWHAVMTSREMHYYSTNDRGEMANIFTRKWANSGGGTVLLEPLESLQRKLSIDDHALDGVSVLVLPENVESATPAEFRDTGDGISLAKHLKAEGLSCKTAYDLGLRPKVLDRHGVDVWLGVIWLIENFAAPTTVGVILLWLASKYQNNASTTIHVDLKLQDGKRTSSLKYDGSLPNFLQLLSGLKRSNVEQIESDERPQNRLTDG